MRLIKHLIKFLQKLSKIETDKNFLKRGKVDVIIFTFVDKYPPHLQWVFETMTTLPLSH